MANAFHLSVSQDRLATLVFDSPERKVNVFTAEVVAELGALIPELARRGDIECLVLISGKRDNFIAGADVNAIAEVSDPVIAAEGSRVGQRLFSAWESLPFPTVAAIHGTCLGGGTEICLASTYRVASDAPNTKIGLPEVKLGILPAWGGCTRLPRLVGLPPALEMILQAKNIAGFKALKMGLVDALLPAASFQTQVREFALAKRGQTRRGPSKRGGAMVWLLEKNPLGRSVVFSQAKKQLLAQTKGQYPGHLRALEAVRIGLEKGREAGFEAEARFAGELATGPISKNLVHVFQLMEGLKKPSSRPAGEAKQIHQTAVLGAGVMGGGIAHLIADQADLPVRMKDVNDAALASGLKHANGLFRKQVERRRLDRPTAKRKLALLRPGLDYSGFQQADLVIEAIVEKLTVKQQVFAELERETPERAILASNTSSLSIDLIAAQCKDPSRVVGMHFFNPVDKMPLVEVIAGPRTSPAATATVWEFSRAIGKTPVVVKDGPGFLVNRLLMFYSLEALWLLSEGHKIEDIDRAMLDWGMPLGPMALTDEVGVDVAVKVAHILADAFPDRLPLPGLLDRFGGSPDRLGTKTGLGFYRYENRKRAGVDPAVYGLLGVEPKISGPNLGAMAERMVLPMVNEAARCLAEGVVGDAGSLDLAMIMGTGFPPFRGGLCRWADSQGLVQVLRLLEEMAARVGPRHQPAEALREAAEAGGFYARWPGKA